MILYTTTYHPIESGYPLIMRLSAQLQISLKIVMQKIIASQLVYVRQILCEKTYFNNISLVSAEERINSLIAIFFGIVKYFSHNNELYKSLNKILLPTNNILKRELMRCVPSTKPLHGKNLQFSFFSFWRVFISSMKSIY